MPPEPWNMLTPHVDYQNTWILDARTGVVVLHAAPKSRTL
jgi:hypothetical protein